MVTGLRHVQPGYWYKCPPKFSCLSFTLTEILPLLSTLPPYYALFYRPRSRCHSLSVRGICNPVHIGHRNLSHHRSRNFFISKRRSRCTNLPALPLYIFHNTFLSTALRLFKLGISCYRPEYFPVPTFASTWSHRRSFTLADLSPTQNTVVVVSGESARQAFFTARGLDLTEGFKILSGAVC